MTGFSIEDALPIHSNGIVTGSDSKFVADSASTLHARFGINANVEPFSYRVLDKSYLLNDPGQIERDRSDVMDNYRTIKNVGLLTSKAFNDLDFAHAFVTDRPSEAIFLSGTSGSNAMNFPLWIYDKNGFEPQRSNFSPHIVQKFTEILGEEPAAQQMFDYLYGVLHDPTYRRKYRQALSIAYPHIPYPKSPDVFRHVSEKGEALRRLHLMETAAIGETPYRYDGEGDDVVASGFPKWEKSGTPDQVRGDENGAQASGRVFINADQYFDDVPEIAWNFHIGGYQPAQKWLKDRRGRSLSFDDIGHYQKIVKILIETDRIMREIELPLD
ncbi:MAG: type ISP restriction/modification enzyme [Sphingopyxis sp.]